MVDSYLLGVAMLAWNWFLRPWSLHIGTLGVTFDCVRMSHVISCFVEKSEVGMEQEIFRIEAESKV